jgi:hypothetical protein
VGLGGGLEADFLEEAPEEAGLSAMAELNLTAGPVSGKVGGEFDLICGTGKGKLGGKLGPLQGGLDSEGAPSAGLGAAAGAKVEGKAGFKACLPPPPG